MKKGVIFVLILLILPIAFAEIDVKNNIEFYNIGDKVKLEVSVLQDRDVDGFFKLRLECKNLQIDYYIIPISLEEDVRSSLSIPDLSIKKDMIGDCRIRAVIEDEESTIEKQYTDSFIITDQLTIDCQDAAADPGQKAVLTCTARKKSGELAGDGLATINYRKNFIEQDLEAGFISREIKIEDDTPSGTQKIAINVKDDNGNIGDTIFEVKVNQIPTSIKVRLNKTTYAPYETIQARPILKDHANDVIDTPINVEFLGPDDNLIASKAVLSTEYFNHECGCLNAPGEYKLICSAEGLKEEKTITITSFSKIEMAYQNQIVTVTNVGNVDFEDEVDIIATNKEGKTFNINNKVKLEPCGSKEIDVSKEVIYGFYDLVGNNEKIVENVEIQDNRNIIKKTGSGLASISGAATATVGYFAARPFFATLILVIVVLGILFFYSKDYLYDKISNLRVKVKKEEDKVEKVSFEEKKDTEELFKDFDFEKKE